MDVNQLRDELESVQKQRAQSEKKRLTVDKQLADAANNTKKIQQVSLLAHSTCTCCTAFCATNSCCCCCYGAVPSLMTAPCDVRALCLPTPWWAVLGSRYPSTMHTNYPDTSVSDAPLAFLPSVLIDRIYLLYCQKEHSVCKTFCLKSLVRLIRCPPRGTLGN